MNPLVEIKNLSFRFSPHLPLALSDISGVLCPGQFVGLVGPDGAGKTTLIRLLAHLLTPSSGTISTAKPLCIGYMPQRFGLYEDLTVMENLRLYADLRNLQEEEKEAIFQKLLSFTNLAPFTKRLAKNLSGGMKQKLGLACALLKKPDLLLLDEPSVGVDPISRRELWSMVHSQLDPNIAILWSTTYLDEAEKCDVVFLLSEGTLHFYGKPEELTSRVKDKVFLLEKPEQKRALFRQLVERDEVIDGCFQGGDLRFVLKKKIPGYDWKEVSPRFEDAFVDLLQKPKQLHHEVLEKTSYSQGDPVIANHLTRKYADFVAANDVNFTVKRGEVFGLLGPNGAGKSTTFKMLTGLIKPTSGEAWVGGIHMEKNPTLARKGIGYMAQKFSLYGNLTVQQNLDFFRGVYQVKEEEKIKEVIDRFGLKEYLHTFSDSLPAGFKQRLSFAIATIHSPDVLFLDEPTSGMDPVMRRAFWRDISRMAENGVTIVVTTHFMDEAENCDRIALIYQGKIIHMGTADDLRATARSDALLNPTLEDAFVHLIEAYNVQPS